MKKEFLERLKQLPIPRFLRNKFVLTGIGFFLWILLFDPINLIDLVSEQHSLRKLRNEKVLLEQKNEVITNKIKAFSNPDSLEKVAREQFYFVAPGEEIFIVE